MVSVMLMVACEGPTGPAGPPGDEGPQGEEGDQGEPGSIDAFYSDWIPFQTDQWDQVTEFGKITQLYEISEGQVTRDIVDQGAILVYIRFGGAPDPRPLPFVGYITTTTTEQLIWFRFSPGRIVIAFSNLSSNDDPGIFGSGNSYRYVIIPGGTPVAGALVADPSSLSYEEASRRFGIPPD